MIDGLSRGKNSKHASAKISSLLTTNIGHLFATQYLRNTNMFCKPDLPYTIEADSDTFFKHGAQQKARQTYSVAMSTWEAL